FLEYKIQTGGYYVPFGNPNLKPEMTTAYEVGLSHQMNDYSKFDVSVYYKDVRDLVQVANIPSAPYSFASFRNKDFATLKGLDLAFTLRRVNHVSGSLSYSLSFANGTGSVSNTQRNIAWTASEVPHQTSPLDFDQRHRVNLNVAVSFLKGEGPKWGSASPLGDVDLNILYNLATGTPYTTGFLDTDPGRAVAADLRSKGIDPVAAYNLATQSASLFSIPRTLRFGVRT